MAQDNYSFLIDKDIVNLRKLKTGEWIISSQRAATSSEQSALSSKAIDSSKDVAVHK